jgi:polysaccharide export outer membrane protein
MFKNLVLFIIAIVFSSCISNKDIDIFSSKDPIVFKTTDYSKKIKVGDLLSVNINSSTPKEYNLFNSQIVSTTQNFNPYLEGYVLNDSGYVNLPILGSVYLLGKTMREAEIIIFEKSKFHLQNPTVKINVLNYEINVLGEVRSPGKFLVQKSKINILDAISLAGGFNMEANRKKVKLIRLNDNKSKILYFDLSDVSVANNPNFYLESNDIIFVLPVKKRFLVINNLSSAISIVLSTISLYLLISQTN